MKKYISLLMVLLIIGCVFAGCTAAKDSKAEKSEKTTASASAVTAEGEKDKSSKSNKEETSGYTDIEIKDSKKDIKEASLSEAEACDKIKALSMEKLGLEGKKEDYKFMIATKGKVLDGKDYLEVVASQEEKKNEDGSIVMYTRGTYYISYDGKEIIGRNMTTGELFDIEK